MRDPDLRMRYILELEGSLGEEGQNQIPQDFLMEMMEINEALMELEFDFEESAYQKSFEGFGGAGAGLVGGGGASSSAL